MVDTGLNFCATLETKALKKSSNTEVFESLQKEFKTGLLDDEFIQQNEEYLPGELNIELDISIPKLRNKYNNLKRNWKQIVDRAKDGSGLHVEREPKWFQILHPVMNDTNTGIDDISSSAADTSFVRGEISNEDESDSNAYEMDFENEVADKKAEQSSDLTKSGARPDLKHKLWVTWQQELTKWPSCRQSVSNYRKITKRKEGRKVKV